MEQGSISFFCGGLTISKQQRQRQRDLDHLKKQYDPMWKQQRDDDMMPSDFHPVYRTVLEQTPVLDSLYHSCQTTGFLCIFLKIAYMNLASELDESNTSLFSMTNYGLI